MSHRTVTLEHDGQSIEIDVGIAPVIEALWARGIETCGCCEDCSTSQEDFGEMPAGFAMVAFADVHDARRFARTCRVRTVDRDVLLERAEDSQSALAEAQGLRFAAFVIFPSERIAAVAARVGGRG